MKRIMIWMCLSTIILFPPIMLSAEGKPPESGETLPELILSAPESDIHQEYLGISDRTSFSIPEIRAEIVVIEIYSMYCPHCQREAPAVNSLYERMETHPHLAGKVKLIGIGVGNTGFEVSFYQKTYDVPFPLFSDGDFSIHKKLGEPRTPYFIALKLDQNGGHRVIYSKLGAVSDHEKFMNLLINNLK